MSKRILWIDNDQIFLAPHVFRLEAEGFIVDKISTLTEALEAIKSNKYDLLILDVMLPVKKQEERAFPVTEIDFGRKTGLVFYNRYKKMLSDKGIPVFVFTVREDREICQQFLSAELPPRNFMTKSEGADTGVFFRRVEEILNKEKKS